MGLISDGLTMLNDTLFVSEAESVTYRRWADSASLSIIFGGSEFSQEMTSGAVVVSRSVDILVKTEDWLDIGFGDPKAGDRIEKTDSVTGNRVSYEAVALVAGPCWAYSDSGRMRMRIHCKQVSET